MKLDEEFEEVLFEYIPDKDERKAIIGNLIYYSKQYHKGLIVLGWIAGFISASVLLKWLA